ncbi:MAG: hypothetical protein A3E82_00230 [Gammaproteobacteria bacterium RIFCSPHIGHO2_12_FULL_38_11]|nr:MAG: hypothetical protein A3E82_00230 [Gammaproteobacteria bacterium RIFCSPHIGHO2_12_FULL_38_11]
MTRWQFLAALFFLPLISCCTWAFVSSHDTPQKSSPSHATKKWYFSWGYNKDFWTNSNIHIVQPGLNNNFTINGVTATDYPGWNTGIFNKDLMSPQYNIRIGRFINAAQTWAIELNFDHTKYNTTLNQVARVSGIINGQPINQNEVLTPQYFSYALHNGANNLMLNVVRRKQMIDFPRAKLALVAVGKLGAGVMLPHPENTILGNTVNVGPKASGNYFGWKHGWWQMGGFTIGAEYGVQLVFHKTAYLELTNKEAYVNLSDIQVYDGTASQSMWLNETICSLGVMI